MRTALVTGATRGVEQAVAIAFAEAGWTTYGLGNCRVTLDAMRADCGIRPLAVDLTDRDELRAVTGGLALDALIHAAPRWQMGVSFLESDEAEIDMALEVNLSAVLQLTHAVLPAMAAAGRGNIVLLAPRGRPGLDLMPATVSAAATAFARALHREVAPRGLAVDVFDPGEAPFERFSARLPRLLAREGGVRRQPLRVVAGRPAAVTEREGRRL